MHTGARILSALQSQEALGALRLPVVRSLQRQQTIPAHGLRHTCLGATRQVGCNTNCSANGGSTLTMCKKPVTGTA